MKFRVFIVLALLSMLLGPTACGKRATPTTPPTVTEKKDIPTPTEVMPEPTASVKPTQEPTATTEPTQEPITPEGEVITREAMVESIEIMLLESFPIQVNVVARGNLPDSCTEISEITKERDRNAFEITISTSRPADKMCAQVLVPFEEVIPLDVVGLPAGVYTVDANGVGDTFEFAVDNVMAQPAQAGREYVPTFEEAPCPFEVAEGAVVECGFVVVPEDHNDPDGPTIRIAVAVFKDQSDEHQPDPVMLLTGGPGEKTMENAFALAQIFAPIHPNRDFVVFDQRGAGLSEPALDCPEFVQALFDLLDEADPNVAARV